MLNFPINYENVEKHYEDTFKPPWQGLFAGENALNYKKNSGVSDLQKYTFVEESL